MPGRRRFSAFTPRYIRRHFADTDVIYIALLRCAMLFLRLLLC